FYAVLPPQTDDLEMQIAFEVGMEVTRKEAEKSYKRRGRPAGKGDAQILEVARNTLHLAMLAEKKGKIEKLRQLTYEIAGTVIEILGGVNARKAQKEIRAQFAKLSASARKEKWTDQTKVPHMFF